MVSGAAMACENRAAFGVLAYLAQSSHGEYYKIKSEMEPTALAKACANVCTRKRLKAENRIPPQRDTLSRGWLRNKLTGSVSSGK